MTNLNRAVDGSQDRELEGSMEGLAAHVAGACHREKIVSTFDLALGSRVLQLRLIKPV